MKHAALEPTSCGRLDRGGCWWSWRFAALLGAAGGGQPSSEKYPPLFPREGATKLFENEHIIVWEQVGRPAEPIVHRHVLDILHFAVEPGTVEVRHTRGPVVGRRARGAPLVEALYSRGDNSVLYAEAGLGPHVELAPDPDRLPISIFVEIKGTEPADCAEWSTACP